MPEKQTFFFLLAALRQKRIAVVLLLGFSSGLPLALTFGTLQAWMKDAGVDLATIGAMTLVGLPYTVKYLWAPFIDRYAPPFLGRRRGWLVVIQIGLMSAIAFMGSVNPLEKPWLLAVTAVVVSFLSASQDIVVDAYRADILQEKEYGAGAAVSVFGYRLGMLVSGAMALILADRLPWVTVYQIMAGLMLVGLATAFWGEEPKTSGHPRTLAEAVVQPFRAFFSRDAAFMLLVFIALYKLPDAIAGAMTTPFLLDVGFSKTEIGAVNKGFGLIATVLGSFTAAGLIVRLGIYRSLWAFGILQAVTNLTYMGVALAGQSSTALILAVGTDNLSGGMGTAAFVAFLMSLTDKRYSATQYALLSSLMAITPKIAGAPTGLMAAGLGWPLFFAVSVLGAIPGLAVLVWLMRRGAIGAKVAASPTDILS